MHRWTACYQPLSERSDTIHISDGKMQDVNAFDLLAPEPGAICVMDRPYVEIAPSQMAAFDRRPQLALPCPFLLVLAQAQCPCGLGRA